MAPNAGEVLFDSSTDEVSAREYPVRPGKEERTFLLDDYTIESSGGMPRGNLRLRPVNLPEGMPKHLLFHTLWLEAEGRDGQQPSWRLPDGVMALSKALGDAFQARAKEYEVAVKDKETGKVLVNGDGTPVTKTVRGIDADSLSEYLDSHKGAELKVIEKVGKNTRADRTKYDANKVDAFVAADSGGGRQRG